MIGLYYPYIHFRDENWLKLALIYWSRIARIVPEGFSTRDSDSVRRVRGELGAVIDSPPFSAGEEVATDFIEFVSAHANDLRGKYGIRQSYKWKIDEHTAARAPEGTDPHFGYIYHQKLGYELARLLSQEGLAVWGEGRGASLDTRWIGVHPAIAGVYMTAMAEAIAANAGYGLLADDMVGHVAVGDRSVERLAELLLGEKFQSLPKSFLNPEVIAVIALQTVLPKDLSAVPISKIIELRKKFPAELADFQDWTHTIHKKLTERTGGVRSPAALNEHLTVLEEQEIKPKLEQLRTHLRSLSIETVTGALSVKSPWNIAGTAAAYFLSAPPLAVGGVALTAIPNLGKTRRDAQKAASGNFAAYLLHAQERLTSQTLINKVSTTWRKLSLGL
jgi:hypothetical protein